MRTKELMNIWLINQNSLFGPMLQRLEIVKVRDLISLENIKMIYKVNDGLFPVLLIINFKQNRRQSINYTFIVKTPKECQ